jgi:hypothetical protein
MTRLLDDDDSDWCGFSFSYFFFIWQRSCTINNRAATVAAAGSLGAGLSVSHDSVFGLDISPESDAYFTHHRNQPAAESLPSSASFQYMVTSIIFFFWNSCFGRCNNQIHYRASWEQLLVEDIARPKMMKVYLVRPSMRRRRRPRSLWTIHRYVSSSSL